MNPSNIPSGTAAGSLPGARPSSNGMNHRQSPSTVSDNVMSPSHMVMSPGGVPRLPGRVPTPHDGRLTPGRVPTPSGGRAPTPGDTASPAINPNARIPTPQAPSPATSAPCPSPGAMSIEEMQKKNAKRPPSAGNPHMGQPGQVSFTFGFL